jgi:TonB family protein
VPAPTLAPPTPVPTPAPVVVGKEDPLFVAAVEKKLQEELKKREAKAARDQEAAATKRRAEIDKTSEEAGKSKDSEETARASREKADREEAVRLAREAVARRRSEAQQAAAAAAATPAVKDGDLVETDLVDTPPVSVRQVSPQATRLAIQSHISGTVLLRVLVDENGEAAKVEILRDTAPKVGLGDASKSALQQWRWKPATKDGHKVKTWIAIQVPFKN